MVKVDVYVFVCVCVCGFFGNWYIMFKGFSSPGCFPHSHPVFFFFFSLIPDLLRSRRFGFWDRGGFLFTVSHRWDTYATHTIQQKKGGDERKCARMCGFPTM